MQFDKKKKVFESKGYEMQDIEESRKQVEQFLEESEKEKKEKKEKMKATMLDGLVEEGYEKEEEKESITAQLEKILE